MRATRAFAGVALAGSLAALIVSSGCGGRAGDGPQPGTGSDAAAPDATYSDSNSDDRDTGSDAAATFEASSDPNPCRDSLDASCLKPTQVAVGSGWACALLANETVKCWGSDGDGTLGGAPTTACEAGPCSPSPKLVPGLSGVKAIAGSYGTACAILDGGAVACWGLDVAHVFEPVAEDAGCADGVCSRAPARVPGVANALQLAVSRGAICALQPGGARKCWGNSGYGLLGLGISQPDGAVDGPGGVTMIAAGDLHFCAVRADQTVECWGDSEKDELGSYAANHYFCGTSLTCMPNPMQVTGLSGVTAVASHAAETCAATNEGGVACWGLAGPGFGADGGYLYGSSLYSDLPTTVFQGGAPTGVAVGGSSACVLQAGSAPACWGSAPLGDGTDASALNPEPIANLATATSLALGDTSSCALLAGGTVVCWGANDQGQLGNGTFNASATPVPVVW